MATTQVSEIDPSQRATVESLGAKPTGNAAVTARWRLNDGKILTIAIDLADTPAPLPTVTDPLFTTDDRFLAWLE